MILSIKITFQYSSVAELITDLRKVFYNCKKFHKKGTHYVAHARKLEDHLDKILQVALDIFRLVFKILIVSNGCLYVRIISKFFTNI